jgi:hypothetical protein
MRLPKEQAEVINQFFSYIVDENPEQYSDGLNTASCESLQSQQ